MKGFTSFCYATVSPGEGYMLQSERVHVQMAVLSLCFVFKDFVLFFSPGVKRGKNPKSTAFEVH